MTMTRGWLGLVIACGVLGVTRGHAFESPAPNGESGSRGRLQRNLEAYYHLSPTMQTNVRVLNNDWLAEDSATRQRLLSVMQRYAGWLNRLSPADRASIAAAPAGPERLRVIRETLDREWFSALPKAYRDEYEKKPADRPALLEKWKAEDRERRLARDEALPDWTIIGLPPGLREFRDEIQRYVRQTLEPKLNEREKKRLNAALGNSYRTYLIQVAILSEVKNLRPPGPPDAWRRLADRKPRPGPPMP